MDSQIKKNPLSAIPIPNHSVDWRFLLPLDKNSKLLVIREDQIDYKRSFRELGISAEFSTFDQAGKISAAFDVVAAPLGFTWGNFRAGRNEWMDGCRNMLRLVRPGGTFLVGYSNFWSTRRKAHMTQSSSTFEMRRIFHKLRIQVIRFFGVVPEPNTPEFIFPLSAHSLGFILNHRYRHRFPKVILFLASTPTVHAMLNFLPFYYAVGQAAVK